MKRKPKWVWIELPSGGTAKVRSDVQPETVTALDELMKAVAKMYADKADDATPSSDERAAEVDAEVVGDDGVEVQP